MSNLSQPLEVTIPNPPAPSAVTNVQILDLDIETASAPMKVTWDLSSDSSVDEYSVFVKEATYWDTDVPDFFGNGTITSDKKYEIAFDESGTPNKRHYSPVATVSSGTNEIEVSQTSAYVDMLSLIHI